MDEKWIFYITTVLVIAIYFLLKPSEKERKRRREDQLRELQEKSDEKKEKEKEQEEKKLKREFIGKASAVLPKFVGNWVGLTRQGEYEIVISDKGSLIIILTGLPVLAHLG